MKFLLPALLAVVLVASSLIVHAEEPIPTPSPSLVIPAMAANADPAAATRAWLDTVPADKKASSTLTSKAVTG